MIYQQKPLRWLHLPVSPKKVLTPYYTLVASLVAQGRQESVQLFGQEPAYVCVPYNLEQQRWLCQFVEDWGLAFGDYPGQIRHHYPSDKLLQFVKQHPFVFPRVVQDKPIAGAILLFTDGSSNGMAAIVRNSQRAVWPTGLR